ncbi:MAG: response regulator transcription factor [Pseudomonadota bacterium]
MNGSDFGLSAEARSRILLVEGDAGVAQLIRSYLEREGYNVTTCGTVAQMRYVIENACTDLVLLDLLLPHEDGWSALRWLRPRSDVPVIMLSSNADPTDKVISLELGADDYLPKPCDLRELLARIRCIQRRARGLTERSVKSEAPVIRFNGWTLDRGRRQLTKDGGERVHLSDLEYRLLELLASRPREVMTRDHLMRTTAGREWSPADRAIDVHISKLRRKLHDVGDRDLIRTVRGAGYMSFPPPRCTTSEHRACRPPSA